MLFQNAMDAHFLGDLANGGALGVQMHHPRVAQHKPWPAADAALFTRFREASMNTLG